MFIFLAVFYDLEKGILFFKQSEDFYLPLLKASKNLKKDYRLLQIVGL